MPGSIEAALVGNGPAHPQIVADVQRAAGSSLIFRDHLSRQAAFRAIDLQQVYAALDLTTPRPTLYIASASVSSAARVLEQAPRIDPRIRVIDTHPLQPSDPSGLVIFYLAVTATIVGFATVFQVRTYAAGLSLRRWVVFVCSLAVVGSLVLTLLVGPGGHRLALPVAETWGLLGLQLITAAAFASAMALAAGRWALVPTWVLFIVLGNASSGAVSPPLAAAAVRAHLAVVAVGCDRNRLARRRVFPLLPAGTAGSRVRRLGGGLPRNLGRPSPPSRNEPRRPRSDTA